MDPRSDDRFIADAYRTVLKRRPDADGIAFYRASLRAGLTREAALLELAVSEESIRRILREQPGGNFATAFQLDYPVTPTPRWGWGRPAHPRMKELLAAGCERYAFWLETIARFDEQLGTIPATPVSGELGPCWINGWIPGMDAAALYGMIAHLRPRRYVEIGSGNSTLFARRAIHDHGLTTRIISIDPQPRAEIDEIVDVSIRSGLEDADGTVFDELEDGDILFFDGSHRTLTNSDATVMFTEIMPRLRPGVHMQIHDIWLPDDYPDEQARRMYSEQYLLMTLLLSGGMGYEVTLPCWYVTHDERLASLLQPVWRRLAFAGLETHGCSFWVRRREESPA